MRHDAMRTWMVKPAFALLAVFSLAQDVQAGNPGGASYCPDHANVMWFLQTSDTHIGASGSTDTSRLQWIVTTGKQVIKPSFVVVTGDLTDSTNGNIFGMPNGPYQAEWDQYKELLRVAGASSDWYFDLPGNHDAYNDSTFAYYRANSVQGRATGGKLQFSWTRSLPLGTYHFLAVNTADNTGSEFSIFPPYGDRAGLDASELAYIDSELAAHSDARLTFVFGHHPVTDTGNADDTWLYYGHREFIIDLDTSGSSAYGYGHTHAFSSALFTGNDYTGGMAGGGIRYLDVASLGKSGANQYALWAIDCDAVSVVPMTVGTWPAVVVTAPADARIGTSPNPYAYEVPAQAGNDVRALVFDVATVAQVRYRIDGSATWWPMTSVEAGSPIWHATWDASALSAGAHTLEVQAVGSSTQSRAITVSVVSAANRAPVASADAYSTPRDTVLSIAAPGVLVNDSDPDNDALSTALVGQAAQGTVTLESNGAFTYKPKAGYSGADTFTYVATDSRGLSSATTTVTLTVSAPPGDDTVTITSATYVTRQKTLTVKATSSQQPEAVLTVKSDTGTVYGEMTFSAKSKAYTLTKSPTSRPAGVIVTSSLGGSATKTVTVK